MSATDELRRLLDEQGIEYREYQPNPFEETTAWDLDVSDIRHEVWASFEEFDSGSTLLRFWSCTPEQAIAATLGRGTLTADDVRDLIERHSDASGGNGRDFHNGAYVAIADELNATLGRGTCHDMGGCRWFRCSACGFGIEDMYVSDEDEYPPEDQPKHCPNCGRLVVEVDE